MQVNLSGKELDMIDKALVAWQSEPQARGMSSMLMGAMLNRDESDESREQKIRAQSEAFNEEVRQRERQVILLRAKLMKASAVNREHEVSESHQ